MKRFVVFLFAGLVASVASAQQLLSYIDRPSDAAGLFAIWPGSGVPPGSEKWTWHEQSMDVPGNTSPNRRSETWSFRRCQYRLEHTPKNDADMRIYLQNMAKGLNHPGPAVDTPPVGNEGRKRTAVRRSVLSTGTRPTGASIRIVSESQAFLRVVGWSWSR
jgi:hypothetical protein